MERPTNEIWLVALMACKCVYQLNMKRLVCCGVSEKGIAGLGMASLGGDAACTEVDSQYCNSKDTCEQRQQ
jgi:hypothetical protein